MRVVKASDSRAASAAALVVQRGGLIAYPTDTTYALGVNAFDPPALERLVRLKGRNLTSPISIAVAELAALESLVYLTDLSRKITSTFLPGALTVVLPAKAKLPSELLSAKGFVGIRIPAGSFCRNFLHEAGTAVTATSANPSGSPSALDPSDFLKFDFQFVEGIDLLIDGGSTPQGHASTVIEIGEYGVTLIRPGAIPFDDILNVAKR